MNYTEGLENRVGSIRKKAVFALTAGLIFLAGCTPDQINNFVQDSGQDSNIPPAGEVRKDRFGYPIQDRPEGLYPPAGSMEPHMNPYGKDAVKPEAEQTD